MQTHACQALADPIPNAVTSTIELYALVLSACWAPHQIVVPNASSTRIVHRIELANRNVVRIHALVHAASMLAVPRKTISHRAPALKDTKAILMLVVRNVKVSIFALCHVVHANCMSFVVYI